MNRPVFIGRMILLMVGVVIIIWIGFFMLPGTPDKTYASFFSAILLITGLLAILFLVLMSRFLLRLRNDEKRLIASYTESIDSGRLLPDIEGLCLEDIGQEEHMAFRLQQHFQPPAVILIPTSTYVRYLRSKEPEYDSFIKRERSRYSGSGETSGPPDSKEMKFLGKVFKEQYETFKKRKMHLNDVMDGKMDEDVKYR